MTVWDVAPSQDYVSQEWGCTDYAKEWPVPTSYCAGGFYHAGIDLGYRAAGALTCGRPVYATRAGVVAAVGTFGFGDAEYYGGYLGPYAVCVHYDGAAFVWHGHLSSASVRAGQRVSAGQKIGAIGTLGASSDCHLHIEARADGPYQGVANDAANVRDPRPYLNKEAYQMDPQQAAQLLADVAFLKVVVANIYNGLWTGSMNNVNVNPQQPISTQLKQLADAGAFAAGGVSPAALAAALRVEADKLDPPA